MSNGNKSSQRPATKPILESMLDASRGSFRTLLARVTGEGKKVLSKRLVFLSPTRDCGNTTVAACAAVALTGGGSRSVRFVEADLYRPAAAGYLEVPARPGLVEIASGEASLQESIHSSPFRGLSVVPAGGLGEARHGALADERVHGAIETATVGQEITVIDGPAVLEHAEAWGLGRHATDVVLVARAGKTTKEDIQMALEVLQAAEIKPIGIFLNRFRRETLFGKSVGR